QPHFFEPLRANLSTLLDHCSLFVQDHEVIGASHHFRRIDSPSLWELFADDRFQPVYIGSTECALLHCLSTSAPSDPRPGRAPRRSTQLAGNFVFRSYSASHSINSDDASCDTQGRVVFSLVLLLRRSHLPGLLFVSAFSLTDWDDGQ